MKNYYAGTYTGEEVAGFGVIKSAHTDDLVYESETNRIWVSRMSVEDGMPFNNAITIEWRCETGWESSEDSWEIDPELIEITITADTGDVFWTNL